MLNRGLSNPADWKLSPYTGWTRDHWIEVAGKPAAGLVRAEYSAPGQLELDCGARTAFVNLRSSWEK